MRVALPLANDPFHLFSLCSEERQTQDQPVHRHTSPATTDPVQALEISPSDSYNMQPNTPNSDVGSPTQIWLDPVTRQVLESSCPLQGL